MNKKPLETPFSWTCPYCESSTTINSDDFSSSMHSLTIKNKHGSKILHVYFIICPNPQCKEYSLILKLFKAEYKPMVGTVITGYEKEWQVIPSYSARTFPEYIPKPILDDYYEACKIQNLSPKAAATLARRCLQGMIRDFWGIRKNRLIDEIHELENKVEPLTWKAIDAVRKVGNIGAHMEKDVNIVIDVEPDEAKLLIGLIENLIDDWYITRYRREERYNKIISIGEEK